jgi:hypothetical protein
MSKSERWGKAGQCVIWLRSFRPRLNHKLPPICHLERNQTVGEAEGLMKSKDPNSVFSAPATAGNSPGNADVFATSRRRPKASDGKKPDDECNGIYQHLLQSHGHQP